jgi:putative FmdB family regulatory protein
MRRFCDNAVMPIYTYQASGDSHCGQCHEVFEVRQRIDDERLASCPKCGAPVRRVITPPALTAGGPDMGKDNLERHGFTQYRRAGKGVYEKTAGKGPGLITDED